MVCSKLQSSLDSLGELAVSTDFVPGKDILVQLFMTAVRTINSVRYSLVNQSKRIYVFIFQAHPIAEIVWFCEC